MYRLSSTNIGSELLQGSSPHLRRRRRLGAVATTGAMVSLVVGLRQMGVLEHLPDFPGRIWNSDAVTTSRPAYILGAPDAPLGALGFTAAVILASRLGASAPGARRWVGRLLGATVLGLAGGAAAYLAEMLIRQRRLCPYCLTTALAGFALVPLALPDALARGGRD
jgi:uncharacterized membrane protein